jgi:SNF2 family DNA or RNA helicase
VDVVKGLTYELSRRAIRTLQVSEIYGAVKESDRVKRIQDFQTTSNPAVIIGQIQAMGEGVTLTASSDCVMVEESWIPGQNDQFSDRLHRIGQNEKVTVWHLIYRDSIDSKVFSRTTEKKIDMTKIVG